MSVFTFNWCRVEGTPILDLKKEYGGSFSQLPISTKVFYGTPEIQINNPTSITNGSIYKVVPISEFGYTTILDIDSNYATLLNKIGLYDKNIDMQDAANSCIYYYEPFIVEHSCVIFHCDSTKNVFDHYSIIYIDEFATPEIITVVANYLGQPVAVGDPFYDNPTALHIYAVYSDGNRALIKQGYFIEPANKIVTQVGSNVFTISYTTPTHITFKTSIVVEGIKKLTGIRAYYDGPDISYEQEALRKYFVVVAEYSDGSSATVTDFTFPNGNIASQTNSGAIAVYYNGFWATVTVTLFTVSSSRLIAYYNGPNIEINHAFETSYCKIKIYYKSSDDANTYYEDIPSNLCVFSTTNIDHEGVNYVLVEYTGKAGKVSTTMIVIGIKPDVMLNFIEAVYTGPDIYLGSFFSVERIICKAHYSDGAIVVIKNFKINSNIIKFIGVNEFLISYKEKETTVETTISIIGLKKDDTSESGYNPIYLNNNYPEATRVNNRYRGPAEAYKHDKVNHMIKSNILSLYGLYSQIENSYNKLIEAINGDNSIKAKTLNQVTQIEIESDQWMHDKRFTKGKYEIEQDVE